MLTTDQSRELYRQYAPAALRRAQRLLGNLADANDLVHDVFVTLLERGEQYRGASSLSTYLYAAVTYACLNRIRDCRRQSGLLAWRISDETHTASAELVVIVRDLLERLPVPLAELAVHHYLGGLSQRETARVLGCSHTRVAQLLERLSQWLNQHATAV